MSEEPSSFRLPLTFLCDLPLLFVYFQVNNGVLYFLDYVEDIYILLLCSRFNVVVTSSSQRRVLYAPVQNRHNTGKSEAVVAYNTDQSLGSLGCFRHSHQFTPPLNIGA